jgi:hypothetical protein
MPGWGACLFSDAANKWWGNMQFGSTSAEPSGISLSSLRPGVGANLRELRQAFEAQDWRACLPSSSSDAVLLGLAHDMRAFESAVVQQSKTNPSYDDLGLASPVAILLQLLIDYAAGGGPPPKSFNISKRGMLDSLKAYQWALEREIVTRIIGLGGEADTEVLLETISKHAKQPKWQVHNRKR